MQRISPKGQKKPKIGAGKYINKNESVLMYTSCPTKLILLNKKITGLINIKKTIIFLKLGFKNCFIFPHSTKKPPY